MTPVEEVNDDDIDKLVRLTSEGLSMGPSIVTNIGDSFVLLSKKLLHLGLYDCSLRDISMESDAARHSTRSSAATHPSTRRASRDDRAAEVVRERGVPGFPDFPDFWVGASSACRHDNLRGNTTKDVKSSSSSPPASRQHPSSPPLQRIPVNMYGIKSALTKMARHSKAIKKAKRDERKSRRIAKIAQLKERRRRKIDMGEVCRGMGLIKFD